MKRYGLRFTPEASQIIARLPPETKKLIRTSLDEVVLDPFKGDELQGELSGFRSLKPKRFRVIYKVNEVESLIEVYYVGARRDVYENFRLLLREIQTQGEG